VQPDHAKAGKAPPDDPYNHPEWDREVQKVGILVLINAEDETSAVRALRDEGITKPKDLLADMKGGIALPVQTERSNRTLPAPTVLPSAK
jgi:hypothetical protein